MQQPRTFTDELYQWNQTSLIISAVTTTLNFILLLYSLNVNDGVVFFLSLCSVIIQSIIVCSPAIHYPVDFDNTQVSAMDHLYRPYSTLPRGPLKPRPLMYHTSVPGSHNIRDNSGSW